MSELLGNEIFCGVDGGGTKTRAVICDVSGKILGTAQSGPSNPVNGFRGACLSVTQACTLALKDAGLPTQLLNELVVGAGLAGLNLAPIHKRMNTWPHPFKQLYLTTDLHIACLGAHKGGDGAVTITGTGSCGYASVGARSMFLGGHGFTIGDKASGAWIGAEAVRAVMLAQDGIGPHTELESLVASELQTKGGDILSHMVKAAPRDYARLAPLVFAAADTQDEVALSIVDDGVDYLEKLISRLLTLNPPRFSMLGGISQPLQKWLSPETVARVLAPFASPEYGAFHYALKTFTSESEEYRDQQQLG